MASVTPTSTLKSVRMMEGIVASKRPTVTIAMGKVVSVTRPEWITVQVDKKVTILAFNYLIIFQSFIK